MMKFIEQYKTTGYDDGGFAILRERTDNPRTLLFLDIAEQVYHHYQSVLKQRNQIDFADMINDAHFYLQEIERQNVMLPYKYIIIDEFQDIQSNEKAISNYTGEGCCGRWGLAVDICFFWLWYYAIYSFPGAYGGWDGVEDYSYLP